MELLDRLVGAWSFEMQHVQLPAPVRGEQDDERVLDGAFRLVCRRVTGR